jgi:cytochrome d ubiquinol oxidase subunit I
MQLPVGYVSGPDGKLELSDFWSFVLNPWAAWQYAHNMTASVITASFVVAGVGAYWALMGQHRAHARICLGTGVIAGLIACVLVLFPTGDQHGKLVARHQPVTLAAMEGVFEGGPGAELAIIGQPNVAARRLENPIVVPYVLSFLAYGSFGSTVKGLNDFPENEWPHNVELLYYAYHIMVGLGTIFFLVMTTAAILLSRNRLEQSRRMLWVLMLAVPFPYIATTAGWWTAELGRQPWLVYGLQRTAAGGSPQVSAGDVVFTTLGFAGLCLLLGLLFVYQVVRILIRGPVIAP